MFCQTSEQIWHNVTYLIYNKASYFIKSHAYMQNSTFVKYL